MTNLNLRDYKNPKKLSSYLSDYIKKRQKITSNLKTKIVWTRVKKTKQKMQSAMYARRTVNSIAKHSTHPLPA